MKLLLLLSMLILTSGCRARRDPLYLQGQAAAADGSQQSLTPDNQPVAPYRIADGLYFVGASDISSYLITSPAGHILIDGGYESTVPQIEANISRLGFRLQDVKTLLNTQAHFDHAGGFARLKQKTGAQLMISGPDVAVIESGGAADFLLTGAEYAFPPVKVDRHLQDGEQVRLGGRTLTAVWTPGHTKGCTTWTFDVADRGRSYKAVVLCGLSVLRGTRVSGMPTYPTIKTDYERTFGVLKRLPVDIFLGAHQNYYNGSAKARRLIEDPDGPNPFIDPAAFRAAVEDAEKRFRELLAREKQSPLISGGSAGAESAQNSPRERGGRDRQLVFISDAAIKAGELKRPHFFSSPLRRAYVFYQHG